MEEVLKETVGGAFVNVVGVACLLERAQEVNDGHWVSTSKRYAVNVDLNVISLAAESPRRFFVTLWSSIFQAVGTIVDRVFEDVVDGTKRLDFVFLLGGEGPRLRITESFAFALKLSFLTSFKTSFSCPRMKNLRTKRRSKKKS